MEKSFDWNTFNAMLGAVAILVIAATAYIKMSIRNNGHELKDEILEMIKEHNENIEAKLKEYQPRETLAFMIGELKSRVRRLERKSGINGDTLR